MLSKIRGEVRFREPLGRYLAHHIGGPAPFVVLPDGVDDLRRAYDFARSEGLPVVIIGEGHDLLPPDDGLACVAIKLVGTFRQAWFSGNTVAAGSGMSLNALISLASLQDLGGLESFAGIPTSVGGAVMLDVAVPESRFRDFVEEICYLTQDGELCVARRAPVAQGGADIAIPRGGVIVRVRLGLKQMAQIEVMRQAKTFANARKRLGPILDATIGRVWQDPPGGQASDLLRRVRLHPVGLNGMMISLKDPNFMVNIRGGCAHDVLALMAITRERVWKSLEVKLEPAVRILGEDAV